MRIWFGLSVLFILGCQDSSTLTMGGSSSTSSLLNLAIEEYGRIFPQKRLSYLTLGTDDGLQALLDGRLQMAFISREPKEEEMSQGLRAIPLAEDPIVLIGNMDLPVENLRTKDIQAYLEGDKDDSFWVNMKFVHREASSGSRSAFLELLGVNNGEVFSPDLLAYSDKEVIQKVILNPGSMGYISYSFLKEALSLGVKPLSLDGLKPWQSKEDLILYPLARRLYLVMRDLDHQPTLTPMQNESMRQFIQLLTWDEIEAQWVNHGVLSTSLERLQDLLENWP